MKRLVKVLSLISVFVCIGLAIIGLLTTELLRTSKPSVVSTAPRTFPSVIPNSLPTYTPRPVQNALEFVTIIPDNTVSPPLPTATGNVSVTATLSAFPTLSSALDATWTAQASGAGTAAVQYQNQWQATMTRWAIDYAARQQTATVNALQH